MGKWFGGKVARIRCKNASKLQKKTVKTSELEDQDAVILGLVVWPEGPREIDFFKKSWFSQNRSSTKSTKITKNELKLVPVAPFGLILSQNRSQCIQEAF